MIANQYWAGVVLQAPRLAQVFDVVSLVYDIIRILELFYVGISLLKVCFSLISNIITRLSGYISLFLRYHPQFCKMGVIVPAGVGSIGE